MQVHFVGAGPGDPELITVKGRRLLQEADVVIYTGSLINPAVLAYAGSRAALYNSAGMTLPEVLAVIERAVAQGQKVVRLHTGDPGLYGAIQEQMDAMAARGIAYQVVPGISSFLAAGAALKRELTLPGVTQTVIITRAEGRTALPASEDLAALARHRATMCLFLSIHLLDQVIPALQEGYGQDAPVAVVYKASWPEERIIRGELDNIKDRIEAAGISKTALILVGDFLNCVYETSKLYDPGFSHGYREATGGR